MTLDLSYTPEMVSKALMRLAAEHGDVDTVAGMLIDDEYQVPADTLRYWMLEGHAEQYKRLETELANGHERAAVARSRETIARAATVEADLLEKVAAISQPALMPNALRAVADVKAKGITGLLQLTGRPINGAREGGADAMGRLVQHMMDRGYLKAADGVTLEPPVHVDNEADGESECS